MMEGAHQIYIAPKYNKGYDSANFFCDKFPTMVGDQVIRVIKGYGNTILTYPFYNLL